jgi:flagellar hook-basal body complex protein FliE
VITPVSSLGAAGSATAISTAKPNVSPVAGSDFASVLASIAGDAHQSLKAGETAAISGLTGKMPLQQVVGAVMAAEQSLTVAIAVRDKVIGAYTEIVRMSI